MPVSPFSRYRNLPLEEVSHSTRGVTRSLAIRRTQVSMPQIGAKRHRFAGYDTLDLLALKHFGREELYWHLMDANGARLPDHFQIGEIVIIPPVNTTTRIERP